MTATTAAAPAVDLAPVAALQLPDQSALNTRAKAALDFIESFVIDSPETYGLASDELKTIKARANKLEEQRTGLTGPLNKVIKGINDLFRGPAGMLEQAEAVLKRKMLAYSAEQERIAAEERRRAEEAARVERMRLEAEAAERQRVADEAAAAAAAAAAKGDQVAAETAAAEAQRAAAEAQTVAATAQMVVAAPVALAPVKAAGISTSTTVDFEVQDLHALVKHVAAHPELIALLRADDVRIRGYVRGLGLACQLPGVRVFPKQTLSARAA